MKNGVSLLPKASVHSTFEMRERYTSGVCAIFILDLIQKCSFFLDHFNYVLPVDCETFPDSTDPAVCFQTPDIVPPAPQCKYNTGRSGELTSMHAI